MFYHECFTKYYRFINHSETIKHYGVLEYTYLFILSCDPFIEHSLQSLIIETL